MPQPTDLVPGLEQAVAQFGTPVECFLDHQVSEDTFTYWQSVCKKRSAEVVLLFRCGVDRYLVHTKSFYPSGTYRLLSGGIKPGEDLVAAAQREALEETGFHAAVERFVGILHHRFVGQDSALPFTSYLLLVAPRGYVPSALDTSRPEAAAENITGYREVTLDELAVLATELGALPPDWVEWGSFRATAHRLAARVLGRAPGDSEPCGG